jgi:hypothetical protein
MKEKKCLNCGAELLGKYCSICGQKSDTQRISLRHFIFHDVLHGTLHLEKGMLFTAKQTLLRPGMAALDCISGKRVNYYNIFYFILLLIGLNILLTHYYNEIAFRINPSRVITLRTNEAGMSIREIFSKYGKSFIFALVPVTALNSFLLFKIKKLNYSEHFIISGMLLLGVFLITTLVLIFSFSVFLGISANYIDLLHKLLPLLIIFYILFGYWNAFRKDYSMFGFGYRMLIFSILFGVELISFAWIIVGIATDWKSETEIELSF